MKTGVSQMSLKKYIKNKKVSRFSISGINVEIFNKLTNEDINVKMVINKLLKMVPSSLMSNVKNVYIGNFDYLNSRKIEAAYKDSSIYLVNTHHDEHDMLDDLVHEVAHSIEEIHGEFLYSDGLIEREFLQKRKSLKQILDREGFFIKEKFYYMPKYNKKFDAFLHREVGYVLLTSLTKFLFYSPYAATSINEYFANGFEAIFYNQDFARVKNVSPILYDRIERLTNEVTNK
jgi:hypothetical protein